MESFNNLGGIERAYSPKDLELGSIQPIEPFPEIYMQDVSSLPTFYQRQIPACGAHAAAWYKTYQEWKETGKVIPLSPRYSWDQIKKIDGYPLEDGTDLRSIFKSLQGKAVCSLDLLPNDTTLPLLDYSDPNTVTLEMEKDAQPRVIENYAFINSPSFEQIKSAIYKNGVAICLLKLGKEWWTDINGIGSWKESDVLPCRTPNKIVSGHFVVLHSYDQKYIYFRNSWSENWGRRKGDGYFGEDYIPYVKEIGTSLDLDDSYVSRLVEKRDQLQKLVDAYLSKAGR